MACRISASPSAGTATRSSVLSSLLITCVLAKARGLILVTLATSVGGRLSDSPAGAYSKSAAVRGAGRSSSPQASPPRPSRKEPNGALGAVRAGEARSHPDGRRAARSGRGRANRAACHRSQRPDSPRRPQADDRVPPFSADPARYSHPRPLRARRERSPARRKFRETRATKRLPACLRRARGMTSLFGSSATTLPWARLRPDAWRNH
jgi:hypothetical protein